MNPIEILALYNREQRIGIEYPGTRKEVTPTVVRFLRPAPGANFVEYAFINAANADAVIAEQIAYFAPLEQKLSWDVYDHDQPADLGQRLEAHGFELEDEPGSLMALDLREPPPALLAPLTADVRPITTRAGLTDVIQIENQVWGGNFAWITQRLGDHLEIPGYLSVRVAYVDQQPACAGWVYYHPHSQFASLYGGSTLEQYRGHGLYTAVLAARVQEAVQRGYRYLVIDASSMSRPIVEKQGFKFLTRTYSYKWEHKR